MQMYKEGHFAQCVLVIRQHRPEYSDLRCEVTGKVVIANRDMGSTAVLRVTALETQGMATEEKRQWCAEHGKRLHDEDGPVCCGRRHPEVQGLNAQERAVCASCATLRGQKVKSYLLRCNSTNKAMPFQLLWPLLRQMAAPASLLRAQRYAPNKETASGSLRLAVRRYAAPRRGGAVENYAKVAVLCSRCGELLAVYRKRNARKSQLVKMHLERIAEDTHGLLADGHIPSSGEREVACPNCQRSFCRGPRLVNGRPAWKIISGRIRMK
eukprot:s1473_g16.t1